MPLPLKNPTIFRVISGQTRISLLMEIEKREEISVNELVENTGIEQSLISHHLKELKKAGLVACRKAGQYVFYRLDDIVLWLLLKRVFTHRRDEKPVEAG